MRQVFVFDYWPASQGRLPPSTAAAIDALIERRGGLSDHLRLDLHQAARHEPSPGYVGIVGRDSTIEESGLRGYAQVSEGNGTDLIETVIADSGPVDPVTVPSPLAGAMLDAALDAQALYHPGQPALWWTDNDPHSEQIAEQRAMVRRRLLHQMAIDLPTTLAPTIETRSFLPSDTAAWLRINNAAFAGHGEQGAWTPALFEQRQAEDWFDPDGLRIAEVDGQMAGFCWTKIHRPGTSETAHRAGDRPAHGTDDAELAAAFGEIYVIAVDPAHGGKGLGTELVLAGLDAIHRAGVSSAILFVDADNTRALDLYRRLGFSIGRSRTAYEATPR